MKQAIRLGVVAALSLFLLAACDEIEGVDYLRAGHPADPQASAGKKEPMSGALIPENISPTPGLSAARGGLNRQPGNSGPSQMHRGSH